MFIYEGEKCFTLDEAAQILSIGTTAIRKYIQIGTLIPVVISGKKHLTESEIKRYDQRRQQHIKKGARQGVR